MWGGFSFETMPIFQILERTSLFRRIKIHPHIKKATQRAIIVALACLFAMGVPNLLVFTNLIGSLCITVLVYVMPILLF